MSEELKRFEIPDEPIIQQQPNLNAMWNFEWQVFYAGSHWEVRIKIHNARFRFHDKDRKKLVQFASDYVRQKLRSHPTCPSELKEQFIVMADKYIGDKEEEYYKSPNTNTWTNN